MAVIVDTRDRILDAAEKLFGQNGLDATSIRTISSEADVNLAGVNYHFGTKEALYEAVFLRRIRPVNKERLSLLEQAEAEAGSAKPSLEAVLNAFIRPTLILGRKHPWFMAVMSRNLSMPPTFMAEKIAREFEPLINRFRPALQAALPEVPASELFWRMHFVIGSVLYTTAHFGTIQRTALGLTPDLAIEATVQRLVSFACAGLRQTPSPTPTPR